MGPTKTKLSLLCRTFITRAVYCHGLCFSLCIIFRFSHVIKDMRYGLGYVHVKFKMKVASDLCVNIEYRYFFLLLLLSSSVFCLLGILFNFLFLHVHLRYFSESVRVETLDVDQLLLGLCAGLGQGVELTRVGGNSSEKRMRGFPITHH